MPSPTRIWAVSHADLTHGTSFGPTSTFVRAPLSGLGLQDGDYLLACTYRLYGDETALQPPTGWELVTRLRVAWGCSPPVTTTLELWGHTVVTPVDAYAEWVLPSYTTTVQLVGVGYRGVYAPDPVHRLSTNYGYADYFDSPTITTRSDNCTAVLCRVTIPEGASFLTATGLSEPAADDHLNTYLRAFDKSVASAGAVGQWPQVMATGYYLQILAGVASEAPPPQVYHKRGTIALL